MNLYSLLAVRVSGYESTARLYKTAYIVWQQGVLLLAQHGKSVAEINYKWQREPA